MYFKNNQTLIIRLGQQFKQIMLSDEEQFFQVLAKQRKAKIVYHNGKHKFKTGDYVDAIADFTEALKLGCFNVKECYFLQGKAKVLTGDFSGAVIDASKIISLDSHDANAYYWRAWAYLFLSRIKFALEDVEQVLQLDKNLSETHVIRSLIYFKQDNLNDAIAVCKDLIKSENCEGPATFLLAQFYRYQKNETAYQTELAKVQEFVDASPFCNLIEEWIFPQLNDALATVTNQLSATSLEKKELYEELEVSKQSEEEHNAGLNNSSIFTLSYQSQPSVLTPNEDKKDKSNYQPSF